ncbi:MAG: glycosyltransferase family 2 protein [Sulfurimonas sp.]|nr:glycosyltransferase family 2 protein [Sulfurimonas sp.]
MKYNSFNKENNISVLLSTYNGDNYLEEQLDSLLSQTNKNFRIIARDDCSNDNTLNILNTYGIEILASKTNLGAKGSLSALLEYAVQNSDSNYFMFCDQDDVWKNDKIEKTLAKMLEIEKNYSNIPVLVHTDLKVVDEELTILHQSFMSYQGIEAKYNNLNNLLIQNTITGCTMMINRKLAKVCLPIPSESIMHDWWIGLVASKFGKIAYVDKATINYRQHNKNSVGAKQFNLKYILENIYKNHSLSTNIFQAKSFLDRYRDKLDKKTIDMLEDFISIENKSFWQKRKILLKHKLLKQGLIRNIGLLVKI